MPNLKYYIDINKVDPKGYVPIKANIATDSKNNWKTVGKVKPRHWNKKQQRVSPPRPNEEDNDYIDTNSFLDNYQSDAKKYFRDCTLNKIHITREVVQNYFNGKKLNFVPVIKDL